MSEPNDSIEEKHETITLSEVMMIIIALALVYFGLTKMALPVQGTPPSVIAGDIASLIFVKIAVWVVAFIGIIYALRGVKLNLWQMALGKAQSIPAAMIIVSIAGSLAWIVSR